MVAVSPGGWQMRQAARSWWRMPARITARRATKIRSAMIVTRAKPMRMVLMAASVRRRVGTPLLRGWTGARRPG